MHEMAPFSTSTHRTSPCLSRSTGKFLGIRSLFFACGPLCSRFYALVRAATSPCRSALQSAPKRTLALTFALLHLHLAPILRSLSSACASESLSIVLFEYVSVGRNIRSRISASESATVLFELSMQADGELQEIRKPSPWPMISCTNLSRFNTGKQAKTTLTWDEPNSLRTEESSKFAVRLSAYGCILHGFSSLFRHSSK